MSSRRTLLQSGEAESVGGAAAGRLAHDSVHVSAEAGKVVLHVGGHAYTVEGGYRRDTRDDIDTLLRLSAAAMRAIELIRNPEARRAAEQDGITSPRWIEPS